MKHINFDDYLDYKLMEEPLPCSCDSCQKKIKLWEEEREKFKNFEGNLFFKKQEKMILEKLGGKFFNLKPVIAFAFSLILIFGILIFSNIKKPNKIENFDLEYSKLQAFYEKPVLGDLEACSIFFENNLEKEDI